MLIRFWIRTNTGLGYGVTAGSRAEAMDLLASCGYPLPGEVVAGVRENVAFEDLDQNHEAPNAGPVVVRGVWFPRHNVWGEAFHWKSPQAPDESLQPTLHRRLGLAARSACHLIRVQLQRGCP